MTSSSDRGRIKSLKTKDGRRFSFDFYIDCSGFRSLLLEKTLNSPFIEYRKSLYNDRALTFRTENKSQPRPYTTAKTMQSGWSWEIPMVDSDHCGYVHSSEFCSLDQAEDEIKKVYPNLIEIQNVVNFRSGRHSEAWIGNVLAVGNSFAFVEPLESTGILMITNQIEDFIALFPENLAEEPHLRALYNQKTVARWDALRWFLAIHFKFNKKIKSKYWSEVQQETDISGIQEIVELFKNCGPLSLRLNSKYFSSFSIPFYGIEGLDCILMGQKVGSRIMEQFQKKGDWLNRKQFASQFTSKAIPQHEALEALRKNPWILDDYLEMIVKHNITS